MKKTFFAIAILVCTQVRAQDIANSYVLIPDTVWGMSMNGLLSSDSVHQYVFQTLRTKGGRMVCPAVDAPYFRKYFSDFKEEWTWIPYLPNDSFPSPVLTPTTH